MNYRQGQLFGAFGIAALFVATCASVVISNRRAHTAPSLDLRSAEAKEATRLRTEAQVTIGEGKHKIAEQKLNDLVDRYSSSSDRDTQDQVAAAQMTLGYIAADRGDYIRAREQFTEIDATYAGTDAESPEYGKVDDQAAYQAIVCLQAEGKKHEAVEGYQAFLRERQESPLIFAVHKRLQALDEEHAQQNEELLQKAIQVRDAHIRKELAMCGPRALTQLLKALGDERKSPEQLAELCQTTEEGTTLSNLAAALSALGYTTKGMRLNLEDFKKASTPLIWLMDTHYVTVLGWNRGKATIYDPMTGTTEAISLAGADKTKFQAVVLKVSRTLEEKRK